MNRDIVILREAISKVVQMMSGMGLKVTQRGSSAFVETDKKTLKPIRVNIPYVPDNATDELIHAIQGFMDHEVAHILFTDWSVVNKAYAHSPRMGIYHNIWEDPFIERKMRLKFPGAGHNIAVLHEFFLKHITQPLLDGVQARCDKGEFPAKRIPEVIFGILLVPLVRGWAGQATFVDWMARNGHNEQPLVKALIAKMPKEALKKAPVCQTSADCLALAEEMHKILNPPKKPKPATPPKKKEPPKKPEKEEKPEDGDSDDGEGEEGEEGEASDQEDGEGKGEKEHKEDSKKADGDDTDGDAEEAENDDGEGDEGPAGEDESKDGTKKGKPKNDDAEDDNEPHDDSEVDDLGSDAAGEDDPGDSEDAGEPEPDDGSGAPKPGAGDKPEDEPGADKPAPKPPRKPGKKKPAPKPEKPDDSEGDGPGEPDGEGETPDPEDVEPADGAGSGSDDGEGSDEAEKEGDEESGTGGDADEEESPEEGKGKEAGGEEDDSSGEGDETGESDASDGDAEENESGESGGERDVEPGEPGEPGGGDPEATGGYDFAEIEIDPRSFEEMVKNHISSEAVRQTRDAPYSIYTNEFDVLIDHPMTSEYKDEHFTKLEDSTRHMVGTMQKEIERMMAQRNRCVKIGGFRNGKLHSSGLHKLIAGDPRVFQKKQENNSKDTAVSLVVDCSGSMGGKKIHTAMQAAYALSSTLERVGINYECLGFTTTNRYGRGRSSGYDAREISESSRAIGMSYSRTIPLLTLIYKGFDERLTPPVRHRFADMAVNQPYLSENIDGESVQIAMIRLMKRKEQRKVMIVLSDGNPAGADDYRAAYSHLHSVIADAEKHKIETIGIGICSKDVATFYPKHVVLNDINDLPKTVMGEIRNILLK